MGGGLGASDAHIYSRQPEQRGRLKWKQQTSIQLLPTRSEFQHQGQLHCSEPLRQRLNRRRDMTSSIWVHLFVLFLVYWKKYFKTVFFYYWALNYIKIRERFNRYCHILICCLRCDLFQDTPECFLLNFFFSFQTDRILRLFLVV